MSAKINFICLLFLITSLSACNKDGARVTYHEFSSPVLITSIDSLVTQFMEPCPTPYPTDSSVTYGLDIDQDSKPDFSITVKHEYQFVSASQPCANHSHDMSITAINEKSKIATMSSYIEFAAHIFKEGEWIDHKSEWNSSASLTRYLPSDPIPSVSFEGTGYIGLRTRNGLKWHYSWLKLNKSDYTLSLISFGYNKNANRKISAGLGE